jgi:hypothetical protein
MLTLRTPRYCEIPTDSQVKWRSKKEPTAIAENAVPTNVNLSRIECWPSACFFLESIQQVRNRKENHRVRRTTHKYKAMPLTMFLFYLTKSQLLISRVTVHMKKRFTIPDRPGAWIAEAAQTGSGVNESGRSAACGPRVSKWPAARLSLPARTKVGARTGETRNNLTGDATAKAGEAREPRKTAEGMRQRCCARLRTAATRRSGRAITEASDARRIASLPPCVNLIRLRSRGRVITLRLDRVHERQAFCVFVPDQHEISPYKQYFIQ